MNKTYLFILIIAMLIGGAYLYFNPFWEEDTETDSTDAESITVTVGGENIKDLGGLYIEILYDGTSIEATEVKTAALASSAEIAYSFKESGIVCIGIIDAKGIDGSGEVVTVSFSQSKTGKPTFSIENPEAIDVNTLSPVDIETGLLGTLDGKSGDPVIWLDY